MPSEITHKSAFRPLRYAGWLGVMVVLGWMLGASGVGLDHAPQPPVNAPCPAVSVGPLQGA